MDYRKLLTILMCISVLFLLSLKSFYLDKYLENINNKTTNLQNAKELTLCPEMPPNLGPILINLEEDMSFLHTISENPNVQFGGRAIPQLCKALQKIAIIIPYRNREPHLKTWLHYMHPFLQKQQGEYGVYVVEQIEMSTFNRAKLMNVGFTEASKDYDYNCFIFSDVDIIPMDERNLYRCSQNPKHMANSLDKHNFRVVAAGMKIERPNPNISRSKVILHQRDPGNEKTGKSFHLVKKAAQLMHEDGLNTLEYEVVALTEHRLFKKITVNIGSS
ncbi:beta-1,4-galactosyltransferase 1-like isoform X5 [Aquarana catesbeiana]|uniref:beta-1,4-galactosyltransferase 1-like isoform X5 n=1 Tax=Aquarana catesbeiana TaxID=8400 RepID=UPI003CC9A8BD